MKGILISVFGVLTFIFLFRFFGGLERISVADIVNAFNIYSMDIRDDFEPFLNALDNLKVAFSQFKYISVDTTRPAVPTTLNVLLIVYNILRAIYNTVTALSVVFVSLFGCLGLVIADIVDFMRLLGVLLFY